MLERKEKPQSVRMPIRAQPYDHQRRAFQFACGKMGVGTARPSGGCAYLMEMGCGKTLPSIAVAGTLFERRLISRLLIVAPLSIVGVWESEFRRFADFPYSLIVLKGSSEKKRQQIGELQMHRNDGDTLRVIVVNYESTWRLERELLDYDAGLIIADEAHKLKGCRTSQAKAMHNLADHARFRLLLTGTLITNKEMDVFSQYRFADHRVFGTSFYKFRCHYFEMTGYGNYTPVFRENTREEFLQKLHSIAFRVTKEECLDLPSTTEEVRTVELEPKAMKLYKQLERESFVELSEDKEVSAVNILTKLLRLAQVTGGYLTDDEGDTTLVSRAKLEALSDIVDSAIEEGKKLVVMARFIPEMNDIQSMLDKKKIGFASIRGGVKDRQGEIDRFQSNPECRVFVGQIAAAGLGITLTAASTMVFYSLDYSMSNFEQAKARIHRVSQMENCHYIYLQAKDTVDEQVLAALRGKTDLARRLVDDYRRGVNPFQSAQKKFYGG